MLAALGVLAFVREPRRGGLDGAPAAAAAPKASFASTFKMFVSSPSLVLVSLACGATQIVTYGAGNFSTLYLMRERGMTLQQVALWVALVTAVCMGGGIYVSGRVIDHFIRRSRRTYALAPALSLALAAPLFVAFALAPTWPLALLFFAGPMALNYFYLSSAVALVHDEVAPNQRVLSGALLLLVMNLVGMGVGPTFVGWASDQFRPSHPHNSLQLAFLSLVPVYALAIGLFLALAVVLKPKTSGRTS